MLIVVSTSACTSKPHVRLFTDNLSDADLLKIETKLSQSNIKYSRSVARFPTAITNNSILYTPTVNGNKDIYHIIEVLKISGFDISWTTIFKVENHSFTANNIGVYLFSDEFKAQQQTSTLAQLNDFGSVECGSQLTLNADASFQVLFDIWDEQISDYREEVVKGTWHESAKNQVTLSSNSWSTSLDFIKKISIETQANERIETMTLAPVNDLKRGAFYLLNKNSEPNINCPYRAHVVS